MVDVALAPWRLVIPDGMYRRLHAHLFPGDSDEHGAIVAAGIARSPDGVRLLARELYLAVDGVDYVAGKRGYRMLKADFVHEHIVACRDNELVYLAIHNHGGSNHVAFSSDDMRSHERGYPALLDIANGMPVGALVFAQNAIAGDIWLPGGKRIELAGASIVGQRFHRLHASPPPRPARRAVQYDRQARLFGDAGQDILRQFKVGIIGLGGAGSLLAEYLGRLGVGHFVLADPDKAEPTNLPRLTAVTRLDAMAWLRDERLPRWIQKLGAKFARTKVSLARRNILRANSTADIRAIYGDFLDPEIAAQFTDCDYLFLAADTMRARLLFNAIVHQYLIAGVQVGAKVSVDAATGMVTDAFSVTRPVTPDAGCLWCNRLINSAKLQEESISEHERRRQRYVDEREVAAPSVITLNAEAVAHAANDFLFHATGLRLSGAQTAYLRSQPRTRQIWFDEPRKAASCLECGQSPKSRLGYGDARRLPTVIRKR